MIVTIAWIAAAIAIVAGGWRMRVGPSLPARVAALDVVLVALMGAIAVYAADSGRREWLDLLVVIAVVAFTATVAVSRFIEDSEIMIDEHGREVE